ncbi:G-type lectin S-receptor-like serine/threonine-protein kinase SD3-1 [Mangifera indica]|uniref:G-type lectin S-receptor-like serine/threonine-protein kinase SD3-1 n=1 Tax=Mangifera indica TaxID=29780 RepID=UPI001CF93907|nr:G-type lectin S-receptor-like serine/threonine-protein kinase SD3-1 [Mangifera indica]
MLQQESFFLHSPFLLCISIGWLLLFRVVVSQVPLGSKLSVVENDFWFSSNGDFALGFFNCSDQPNQFSVGIRYNSKLIPPAKQTVVWVAGGDATVGDQSYFQLSQNGELVLFDSSKGFTVWTTKTSQLCVASAILQDDGNFVLINEGKDVVWQSFDTPSDTLLPGQKLSFFRTLRPATIDRRSSSYCLYMNSLGQLLLRWDSIAYWQSGSPSHLNLSAVLTLNGTFQLMDQNLQPVWSAFGEDHGDSVRFRFLRLNADGNLRLYSWVEASQSWRSVWQAVENQCNVFATCGEQGICVFNASDSPDCQCLFKSTPVASTKCLFPNPQECNSGADLVEYEHMLLYGIFPANDSIFQSSLQQCKLACIRNPQCTAVTFTNNSTAQCRMIATQYISGYADPSISSVSFTRKCLHSDPYAAKFNFTMKSPPTYRLIQSYRLCIPCLIGAASGTVVVFIVIQFGVGIFLYRRRKSIKRKAALAFTSSNSKGLVMLSFSKINELSANFKYQIGPKMFKGMQANNQAIVIKKMDATIAERKFRSAVSKIGNIHHKNLIKLEGYCCELSHRYLVYEFANNGSLEKYIQDSKLCKKLSWKKRVNICSSVARALCYLHTECREFVSHGNLKCENVVLDEEFEVKVTEFGLGIFHGEASFNFAPAAKDVEDFGKMVLILVSGRCQEVENVCEWAYRQWSEGNAVTIVDERIDSEIDHQELECVLRIAFWCLQTDQRLRPSMGEVVMVLDGMSNVESPPSPFACGRSLDDDDDSSESALED